MFSPYVIGLVVGVPFTSLFGLFLYTRLTCGVYKPRRKINLSGKVSIVTGANTGIGYITAREFARLGATVVLACRDKARAEEAQRQLVAEIRANPGAGLGAYTSAQLMDTLESRVIFLPLDLSSLTSVRSFAAAFKAKYKQLHLLINNAGVMMLPKRTPTKEGYEMQMGVNHLGHFLLTNLLLPTIEQSAPARIVNLSSLSHKLNAPRFDAEDLLWQKRFYLPHVAYGESKLANVLFTRELHRRLALKGVQVYTYSLHPGFVRTELTRNLYFWMRPFVTLFSILSGKSQEEGAQTTLYCALAEELEGVSGRYFSDCKLASTNPLANDDALAARLWTESERLTGLASS